MVVVSAGAVVVSRRRSLGVMRVLRAEHLDRREHSEEEDERYDDECEQPLPGIVGTEARKEKRGREGEEDEDERGDPEPDLVAC